MSSDLDLCVCGHTRRAHSHYRRGTDCAKCECASFKLGTKA